ncbi:MAG TPA: RNA methyltransferase [Candidatus Acidoferrales bacterium]|jgi:TrmH family RNA methyltransferase|nr:RNA methyltransferase [Candidatus Acidoferrales bacterium]
MAHPAGSSARRTITRNAVAITSRENRWLKRFRASLAGEHDDNGIVGVEGVRLVEAALGSGRPVEALLVSESGARHLPRVSPVLDSAVPVLRTSDKLFASVAETQTPQGIAALVRPRHATIENLMAGTALVAVLVGVQDPGNIGTIVRAAEAFGATGVAACPADGIGTADPFGPKAMRASAGSALRLPIASGVSPTILLAQLRMFGITVYAAVAAATDSKDETSDRESPLLCPWEIDWKTPAAILIGNEGAGLPAELRRAADARVYIPQAAATAAVGLESLNAAMAASVLLYEAMRQRNTARQPPS